MTNWGMYGLIFVAGVCTLFGFAVGAVVFARRKRGT